MPTLDFKIDLQKLGYDFKEVKEEKLSEENIKFILDTLDNMLASGLVKRDPQRGASPVEPPTQRRYNNMMMHVDDHQDGKVVLTAQQLGFMIELWKKRQTGPASGPLRRLIYALDKIICADDFKQKSPDDDLKEEVESATTEPIAQ